VTRETDTQTNWLQFVLTTDMQHLLPNNENNTTSTIFEDNNRNRRHVSGLLEE